MPAYVLSEVTIVDDELADEYRALAPKTIAQYGGRYLVRGGTVEPLEGQWPDGRLVIIAEFPGADRAREWYRSPEYGVALELARRALDRRIILIDAP